MKVGVMPSGDSGLTIFFRDHAQLRERENLITAAGQDQAAPVPEQTDAARRSA
jgi:hypothetical protein